MRAKYLSVIAAVILLLLINVCTQAQESKDFSIRELKEQIAKLESIEADSALPADVRALNQKFLEQRRAQLRALLEKNIEGLRNYRATAASVLTADEIKVLDTTIAEYQKELGAQQGGTHLESASLSTPLSTPASLSTPVSTPVSTGPVNPPVASAAPAVIATEELALKGSDPSSDNLIKDDVRRELAAVIREISAAHAGPDTTLEQARKAAFDFTANPKLYADLLSLILTNSMLPRDEFVRDIEAARIDKQVGGAAGNAGSTSLVTKGGTPAIIGFAVENGALTRTIDGTTITLRGNPVGIVEALQKKGFLTSYDDDSASAKLLRKLSFSASFDTSRGDSPGTFLANRQQLSNYSFRYEFKNDRDPRNPKYKGLWEGLVKTHAQAVANNLSRIMRFFDTHPAYSSWLEKAKQAVGTASNDDLATVVTRQFEALQEIEIPPELRTMLESFQTDFAAYRQERSKLLEIVARGPIFTFEYVNTRRPGLIDTSNLKFIAETGLFKGKGDLTYNGSFTLFNSNPGAGTKRLRDFDNSLRLDIPLGDVRKIGNFVLTFAGQYKRLTENEPGINNKGDIASGQLMFTIPIKGTGAKIPLSFSFANRTEFVKEKEVRGNFGFTFDLDSIFARFNPFSKN